MHFHFKPSDKKTTMAARALSVGIEYVGHSDLRFLMNLSVDKYEYPEVFEMESAMAFWPPSNWTKDGTIRIIVLHRDLQVFVNGYQVYFGPARYPEKNRKLAFCLAASGVNATVSQLSWKEIAVGQN